MKYLLDTHTYLWLLQTPENVPPKLLTELDRSDNDLFLSIASLWEATIKISKGRLSVPTRSVRYLVEALTELKTVILPIKPAHLSVLETLSTLHKDPFDRILAAQSLAENIPLVTVDRTLQQYGIQTVWND